MAHNGLSSLVQPDFPEYPSGLVVIQEITSREFSKGSLLFSLHEMILKTVISNCSGLPWQNIGLILLRLMVLIMPANSFHSQDSPIPFGVMLFVWTKVSEYRRCIWHYFMQPFSCCPAQSLCLLTFQSNCPIMLGEP
jgi:hypothetical protein